MKTIQIEIPEGKEAKWVNGVLTLVNEQPKVITERIKTFEDACKWCKDNDKQGLYEQYADAINVGLQRAKDILAYLKLRIITCALNEGWEPTFDKYEKRWYSWECDCKGVGFYNKDLNYTTSRLLIFKSQKLAEYAATQFKDIYMDFCRGKEQDYDTRRKDTRGRFL